MMNDLFLKSGNMESLITDLDALNLGFVITNENKIAELSKTGHGFVLDYIGRIIEQPGTYDQDGNELTKTTFIEGVHANLRLFGPDQVKIKNTLLSAIFENGTELLEAPSTPYRVWA